MRLNAQQLKRIIKEAVQSKLQEAEGYSSVTEQVSDALIGGFSMYMEESPEVVATIGSNSYEMMMGTVIGSAPLVPARHEDVEGIANDVAEAVLRDSSVKAVFVDIAKTMLESLMDLDDDMKA